MPLPTECMEKGHPSYGGGAPRTTSPSKEEAIELGKDLVKWATEPTDEKRTAWSFWYCLKHFMIRDQFKALIKLPEFRPYYELARSAMAQKIHSDTIEKGMAHRYARMYDRELAEEEDNVKRFDAELKSKEMQLVSDEDKARLESLMSQLSSLQKLSSNSKTACKSECVTKDEDSEAGRSS